MPQEPQVPDRSQDPDTTQIPLPIPSVPEPTLRTRRRVAVVLAAASVITVAYWILWFADRAAVASESTRSYVDFEDSFPLADGWLTVCMLAAAWGLWRGARTTLFWLLAGGGAGLYLFSMDVSFDAEHGIWSKGTGGVIEAAINVTTLVMSTCLLRWSWRQRSALSPHVRAGRQP